MFADESRAGFNRMQGRHLLMAELPYGADLRLMACVWLKVNGIDMDRGMICVRLGKGGKVRGVPLPKTLTEKLEIQLETVRRIHTADLAEGFGEAWLPEGFARKIGPAARDLGWHYLFLTRSRSIDPRSGCERRHHVLASGLQKAVRAALRRTRLTKRVTCHTFRHSYATQLIENGVNIRVVQKSMGHADVKTTEIYTHVMQKTLAAVASPLDALRAGRVKLDVRVHN